MKHLKFLAALCCMLAVFAACNNNNDPKDPNDPNSVEEESYDCDSTEMICTGRAYDITGTTAKVAATVHIPLTLLAQCQLGVQVSSSKEDLMAHENVTNFTSENLMGNDFVVNLKNLKSNATTHYYCAYIYLNGIYHYGLIREFTTMYVLTVKPNNTSYGIVTGAGSFLYGEKITITATPKSSEYAFEGWSDNNKENTRTITIKSDTTIIANFVYANGHEFIDLGLPSGLKWATCNVGATKPEEYGNYYAWGETENKGKYNFNWGSYKWATARYQYNDWYLEKLTRYNTKSSYGSVDGITTLRLFDDAAHANWGGAWRMPTVDEWAELRENCTWTGTDDYNGTGVAGQIVTGPNGNSIFLPAPHEADGYFGDYWLSSLYTDYPGDAWYVLFSSDYVIWVRGDDRCYGKSVRPVLFEGLENGGNSNTDNSSGSVSAPTGTENGHGYVDLGLSVKWATCNVGATAPEAYGNYYAWGETETKTTYDWNTYKWGTATYDAGCDSWILETLTKYNTSSDYGTVDNKTVLDPEDDAARANWGGAWRMPTKEECEELLDNCTLKWVYSYKGIGVSGRIVTGPNGNSIFLPAAGGRGFDDWNGAGGYGFYWSSSLYTDNPNFPNDAWFGTFSSDYVSRGHGNRVYGRSVRPVFGE